jgi:hypothetical protein
MNGPAGYSQDGFALDFDLHTGETVRAVESGTVRWASAYPTSSSWSCYGTSVAIDTRLADGAIITAFYAHLSGIAVAPGQQVRQGDAIGVAGNTGSGLGWKNSTASGTCPTMPVHLHLALYRDPNYLDAKGVPVSADALPEAATGTREPVTSPPYGGTAVEPTPWLDCRRQSLLASPPAGETSACDGLHAGDQLTYTGSAKAVTPTAAPPPTSMPKPTPASHVYQGVFVPTGLMNVPRAGATATLLSDGQVLVAGGYAKPNAQASAELYDPLSGRFRPTGSMNVPRSGASATLLPDGHVLVVGGDNSAGVVVASAELYDARTGTFSPTGSMGTPRWFATATLLTDGQVLVTGGVSGTALASAELYDPRTGAFSPTGSMSTPRADATATLLADGQVLVAGGWSGTTALGSAELYDPQTGAFTPTGSMGAPRMYATATLLPDGQVLVAGGWSGPAKPVLASAELYDPQTGTFSPTGSMGTLRAFATATLLPDGRVLVAGGGRGTGALATAELYDPVTGRFAPTGSMTTSRFSATATLLPSGQVLIAGGDNGPGGVLAAADLYQ